MAKQCRPLFILVSVEQIDKATAIETITAIRHYHVDRLHRHHRIQVVFEMLDVLVFLGAGLSLILTVFLLHKSRKRESLAYAELSSPLSPLKLDIGASQLLDPAMDILGVSDSSPLTTANKEAMPKVKDCPERLIQKNVSWRTLVRNLTKRGELQQAFDICVSAYPLKGALKQSCVIARMMIKDRLIAGRTIDRELQLLYNAAALAAFFYDEGCELSPIPSNRLRATNRQLWESIPFKYSEIGFEFLTLLVPNDIKLIIGHWGGAETHNRVRNLYTEYWRVLVEKS